MIDDDRWPIASDGDRATTTTIAIDLETYLGANEHVVICEGQTRQSRVRKRIKMCELITNLGELLDRIWYCVVRVYWRMPKNFGIVAAAVDSAQPASAALGVAFLRITESLLCFCNHLSELCSTCVWNQGVCYILWKWVRLWSYQEAFRALVRMVPWRETFGALWYMHRSMRRYI